MKTITLLLFLLSFSKNGFCQAKSEKSALTSFMYGHGNQILGNYAHPSCNIDSFRVTDNGLNEFTVEIQYIDVNNNNFTFTCSYDLSFNNGYISNLKPLICGSHDLKCFSASNSLLALGKGFIKIYNDANSNQHNAQSATDKIENYLEQRLAKKIESLTALDYCYGNLYYVWTNNNYQNYHNTPSLVPDYVPTIVIPGKYPQSSLRYLLPAEVKTLDAFALKIMRNEIFARHHYIFKTQEMKAYFSKQAWYEGMFDDVTQNLTGIEKYNIDLIKKYEQ